MLHAACCLFFSMLCSQKDVLWQLQPVCSAWLLHGRPSVALLTCLPSAVLRARRHAPSPPPALAAPVPQPHVDSFDYFLGEGMHHVIENMDGIEVENTLTCVAAGRGGRVVHVWLQHPRRLAAQAA